MNKKAEKFNEMLDKAKIQAFQMEEREDQFHTVLYRSNMQVSEKDLPFVLILDDSIYAVCRVWVGVGAVTEQNHDAVAKYLNDMNQHYKVFKYYMTDENDVVLDCCITAHEDFFDPELIRTILDVVLHHLEENHAELMKLISPEA
jgi:hypothetical protein